MKEKLENLVADLNQRRETHLRLYKTKPKLSSKMFHYGHAQAFEKLAQQITDILNSDNPTSDILGGCGIKPKSPSK